MSTMSARLGSWLVKTTGRGEQGVRDHFEEVMYTREFQRDAPVSIRTDLVKLHQIPSIARLYQLGKLEQKATYSIPSTRFNHIVCLLRGDITQVAVDVIVNSTDPGFSGYGTLDRTLFEKAGTQMQEELSAFGICDEGDVKLTRAYRLPAKHILHAVPSETFRTKSMDVLRKLYRDILHMAISLKATSIAIPAIGTGELNYPRRDCASLAMEEVKRFLESMESGSLIEKIVFCVFGSEDEFIYKSLLPIYFPPVGKKVAKAQPATSQRIVIPRLADQSTPRQDLLIVNSGDQPAESSKRPLTQVEEVVLEDFERHAETCLSCVDIDKVYMQGGHLCDEGYAAAQLVLQHLCMKADQIVVSTNLDPETNRRMQVELPENFTLCLKLLTTVEKSFQDEKRDRPFVSPYQPWPGLAELPGDTTPDAETPFSREPEEAIVYVYTWSQQMKDWRPLQRPECSLYVSSEKVRVFSTDPETKNQVMILSLRLTPEVSIEKYSNLEITIGNVPIMVPIMDELDEAVLKTSSRVLLWCRTSTDCEMLLERMKHAATTSEKVGENQIVQEDSETQT